MHRDLVKNLACRWGKSWIGRDVHSGLLGLQKLSHGNYAWMGALLMRPSSLPPNLDSCEETLQMHKVYVLTTCNPHSIIPEWFMSIGLAIHDLDKGPFHKSPPSCSCLETNWFQNHGQGRDGGFCVSWTWKVHSRHRATPCHKLMSRLPYV